MSISKDSKQWDWGKWGAILTAVSILVAVVISIFESGLGMNFLSKNRPSIAIALAIMGSSSVTYLITRHRLVSKLRKAGEFDIAKAREVLEERQKELESCQNKIASLLSKPVPYYKRFEQIPRIRYGHIEYPPLLDHTNQGEPFGIGITILKEIFRNNGIEKHAKRMFWEEIDTLLYEKDTENPKKFKIDIIATPIFETNDRSQKIGFTSPIFYSEIGLYYSKSNPYFKSLKDMTLDGATAQIRGRGKDIKFHVIEGELSERMVLKYFSDQLTPGKNYVVHTRGKVKVPELIDFIAAGDCDVAFVETFQADSQPKSKDTVANLLGPNQLLYPVAYAVRRDDYVLRRYINLKLLEIDIYHGNRGNGILDLIKKELGDESPIFHTGDSEDEKMKKMRKYFIREYEGGLPFPS